VLASLPSESAMKSHRLAATSVLLILAAAPLALAQTGTGKKKHGKAAASASASASASATDTSAAPTAPSATAADDAAPSASASAAPKELPEGAVTGADKWDDSDTKELDGKAYYFVGLRYRATIIPQFLTSLFVNQGSTFFTNLGGAEFDIRKDGHSTVLSISYANYGFGNTLFEQKNRDPTDPGN
jgi:hypothetical protein